MHERDQGSKTNTQPSSPWLGLAVVWEACHLLVTTALCRTRPCTAAPLFLRPVHPGASSLALPAREVLAF